MKRWITTLGVMLLMPTLAMAQGEMVSISELRGQVEQMGRWKEKYDTVNGEVSIDVPIIVPEVERCPVVTVENQKPWNETMIREIQKKTEKRDGETFCSYDIDGQTVEIQLLTNGNGSTTKYEAVKDVTIQAGKYAADDRQMAVEWKYPWEVDMRQRYIPGKNWTIEQTMEKWQNILNSVYPDSNNADNPSEAHKPPECFPLQFPSQCASVFLQAAQVEYRRSPPCEPDSHRCAQNNPTHPTRPSP